MSKEDKTHKELLQLKMLHEDALYRGKYLQNISIIEYEIDEFLGKYFCSSDKLYEVYSYLIKTKYLNFQGKVDVARQICETEFEEFYIKNKSIFNSITHMVSKRNLLAHCMTIVDSKKEWDGETIFLNVFSKGLVKATPFKISELDKEINDIHVVADTLRELIEFANPT